MKPLKGAQCGPGGQHEGTATTGSLPPIPHTEGPGVASYSGPCCAHTRLVSISQAVRCSAASVHAATVATKTRFQKGPEGLGVPLLHLLLAAWNSQDCLVSLFSAGASSGTAGPLDPPTPPHSVFGPRSNAGPRYPETAHGRKAAQAKTAIPDCPDSTPAPESHQTSVDHRRRGSLNQQSLLNRFQVGSKVQILPHVL